MTATLEQDIRDYYHNRLETPNESLIKACVALVNKMKHDIARFSFRKKGDDGGLVLRTAYGTLDFDIIESFNGTPTGKKPEDKDFNGQIRYFDTEKQAWRSFKVERFATYDESWNFEEGD